MVRDGVQGSGEGCVVFSHLVFLGSVENLLEGDKGIILAYLVLFPDPLGVHHCPGKDEPDTMGTHAKGYEKHKHFFEERSGCTRAKSWSHQMIVCCDQYSHEVGPAAAHSFRTQPNGY